MLKDRKDIYTRKGRAYIFGPDFSYGRPAQIFLTAPTGEWPATICRESLLVQRSNWQVVF
jgi:hypothetical protein